MAKPRRVTKIPGYNRGTAPTDGNPRKIATHVQSELEKVQRNQPNTDTVAIFEDYTVGPFDRTILVDCALHGLVIVQLPPATRRYALPVTIVKVKSPNVVLPPFATPEIGAVLVRPAPGDKINDSSIGVTWNASFVAFSMHPDGIDHWWIEGSHDQVVSIGGGAGGSFAVVDVTGGGTVVGGTPLPGDPTLFLDGEGNFVPLPLGDGPRQTQLVTTAPLAAGASATLQITVAGLAVLNRISVDTASWIEFYATAAARAADAARIAGTDPTPGTGVLAEFLFLAPGTIGCGPPPVLANEEVPPTNTIYLRVTNLTGGITDVNVTIVYTPMETV